MCIFCKIINKEIPAEIVYEDEDTVAFLDINPVTKGHTLVLPKIHQINILECNEDVHTKVMRTVKKLVNTVVEASDAKGVNIIANGNEVGGQTVYHYHVHIIPRYDKDECVILKGINPVIPHVPSELAEKIKLTLR